MIMNNLKTVFLLGMLSSVIISIGALCGGSTGIICAFVMALVMNGIAYFFSDTIVLRLYKAQPLDRHQYQQIHLIVQDLAADMHLPLPRLWLIESSVANAFATGRNPHHASVALTTSIINLLEPHELRGVLAHELSHIKNRDILVSTIAATLAATIGALAQMIQHMVWWQAFNHRAEKKQNQTSLVSLMVVSVLMPLIATLIQLAISRTREYLADETGAHACHDPLALASALEKLEYHTKSAHFTTQAHYASTAHLFIVNPLVSHGIASLFATHPPVEERVKRLHALSLKKF